MSDSNPRLDIVQRVVDAVARKTEPIRNNGPKNNAIPNGKVIGTVPQHLRHLHNLLEELGEEAQEAGREFQVAHTQHEALMRLFSLALRAQVPRQPDGVNMLVICSNWDVVAIDRTGDEDEEMHRDLSDARRAIMGHNH